MYTVLEQPKTINLFNNKGYVSLKDILPSRVPIGKTADVAVVNNARVSFDASEQKTTAEDERLLRYLMEHWHTSPFEAVVFTFEIKCPIVVQRHIVRHRTARLNEQSFRYCAYDDELYFPEMRMQSPDKKQCSSGELVPEDIKNLWQKIQDKNYEILELYSTLVANGASREVSRFALPQGAMTKFTWQMDLHNLLNFLRLRMAPDAQDETRQVANAIYELIKDLVPLTIKAFEDFQLNILTFDKEEQEHLKTGKKIKERKELNAQNKLKLLMKD